MPQVPNGDVRRKTGVLPQNFGPQNWWRHFLLGRVWNLTLWLLMRWLLPLHSTQAANPDCYQCMDKSSAPHEEDIQGSIDFMDFCSHQPWHNCCIQTYRDIFFFFFFGSIHFSARWIQMCEFANVGSGLKNQTNRQRSSVCAHPKQTYQHFNRYRGLFFVCSGFTITAQNEGVVVLQRRRSNRSRKQGASLRLQWWHIFGFELVCFISSMQISKLAKKSNVWKSFCASFTRPEEDSVVADWSSLQCIQSHYCTQLKTQTYNISYRITHHRSRLDSP